MSQTASAPAEPLQLLVLDRVEPSSNMARYYVLAVEPTLFGDAALVREWGRIGSSCRRRLDLFVDHATARVALETWLERKKRRGYILRSGTSRRDSAASALPTS